MCLAFKVRSVVSTAAVVGVAFVSMGESAIAQDRTSWLRDSESATMTGYLLQGEDVYATCDDDCQDLDLFLYDDSGALVDADDQIDAFPIVTAPYEGTFVVKVAMPSCTHNAGCSVSITSDYGF